jgi:hypothetical protein
VATLLSVPSSAASRYKLLTVAIAIDQSSGPQDFLDKRTQKRNTQVMTSKGSRTKITVASGTEVGPDMLDEQKSSLSRSSYDFKPTLKALPSDEM